MIFTMEEESLIIWIVELLYLLRIFILISIKLVLAGNIMKENSKRD